MIIFQTVFKRRGGLHRDIFYRWKGEQSHLRKVSCPPPDIEEVLVVVLLHPGRRFPCKDWHCSLLAKEVVPGVVEDERIQVLVAFRELR